MDITIKIEATTEGVTIAYADQNHDLIINKDRETHHVDLEIDTDEIDLHEIDEDQLRNHLESIYGTMYQEGEEEDMKEHLEAEGYFVAGCIDDAEEEIEEYINEQTNKWIVDPDEIDEVDTMEFVSKALNKKGYYILKMPSFLRAFLGGAK
jgi:hypothetical protein